MEYYFIIKKNEVLIHASTQMNLEQSARSQLQKVTLCMIPFIQNVQVVKFIETEKRRGYQSPGREGN